MHKRLILAVIVLAAATLACSLEGGGGGGDNPQPTPIPTPIPNCGGPDMRWNPAGYCEQVRYAAPASEPHSQPNDDLLTIDPGVRKAGELLFGK